MTVLIANTQQDRPTVGLLTLLLSTLYDKYEVQMNETN